MNTGPRACILSLPRSGTTSLATLLRSFNSHNEFEERDSILLYLKISSSNSPDKWLKSSIQSRFDRMGPSCIDCASYNWLIVDELISLHPCTRFICLYRELGPWINSFVKMLSYYYSLFSSQGDEMPSWMTEYGFRFAPNFDWSTIHDLARGGFNSKGLALLEDLCDTWFDFSSKILSYSHLPDLILMRTNHISYNIADMERFLGIRLDPIDYSCSHFNKAKVPGWVLSEKYESIIKANQARLDFDNANPGVTK